MKVTKRIFVCFALFVSFFVSMPAIVCASSTFTVNIEGVTGQEIQAFTLWFDIGEDFTFSDFTLGDAVPTVGTLGWEVVKGIDDGSIFEDPERGWVYKVDVYDADGLWTNNPNFLVDGELFTFVFDGTLSGLTDVVQLITINAENLIASGAFTYSISDNGVVISAVPVPPAILLLGSGLAGIFAMRRRRLLHGA